MAWVQVKDAGKLGVSKDLSAHELPLGVWTDATNIRFLDGYAYQAFGWGKVYGNIPLTPQYILPCEVSGQKYAIMAGASQVQAVTIIGGVATYYNLTPTNPSSGIANQWTGTLLSGIPILNAADGMHSPMYWNETTGTPFADLLNWPAITYCQSIRAFKNFLVALNVTKVNVNYPYMVKWSDAAAPGNLPVSWDETNPIYLAGEVDIAEGGDIVIDGLQLRDSFIIYKENSFWRMDFIGGTQVFGFTKVSDTTGIMNKNCAVEMNGLHFVLTNSDVIVHDGVSEPQSVLDKLTRRYLFQNIDSAGFGLCFVVKNPFFNEVMVCYPSIGATSCDSAMVWNYKDSTVSFRSLPSANHAAYGPVNNGLSGDWNQDNDSWESDLTEWNGPDFVPDMASVLIASNDPAIYLLDASSSQNGTAVNSSLTRQGLGFDDDETIKLVRGIRPRITGNDGQTVNVLVGWNNTSPYDPPSWSAPIPFTIGSQIPVDCMVSGRYIAIQFASGSASQWRLDSYDIDVVPGGKW